MKERSTAKDLWVRVRHVLVKVFSFPRGAGKGAEPVVRALSRAVASSLTAEETLLVEEGILPARLTKEYLQGCFDAGGILLEAPDGEQQPEEEPLVEDAAAAPGTPAPRTPTSRTRTSRSPVPERRAKRECVMARGFDKFVQETLKNSEFRSKCEAKRKIIKQKKKTVQRVAKQLLVSECKALTDSSKQNYCDQARACMGQKEVRGRNGRFVGVQADENLGDMVTPKKSAAAEESSFKEAIAEVWDKVAAVAADPNAREAAINGRIGYSRLRSIVKLNTARIGFGK